MSLSKKAQWIVWDGRKNGIEAETILAKCAEKGCTDSREDLLKAITSRPYSAQPQRTGRTYTAQQVSPVEALMQKVAQAGLSEDEAAPILAVLKEKHEKAQADAKKALLDSLLAAAQAL